MGGRGNGIASRANHRDSQTVTPLASTSRVTVEHQQQQALLDGTVLAVPVTGQGSKEIPFVLEEDDEDDVDEESVYEVEEDDGVERPADPSSDDDRVQESGKSRASSSNPPCRKAATRQDPPDPVQAPSPASLTAPALVARADLASPRSGTTTSAPSRTPMEDGCDNMDMYCLLCETIVPAGDVARHPTSILHNLSKSQKPRSGPASSQVIQPLIPPTYYALKTNNVGHAMLLKLGWSEEEALGRKDPHSSDTPGRKQPVKASDKFDRKGIGAESKRRFEELEKEGRIVKVPRNEAEGRKVARPLAKNRREMERDRKKDMAFFKAGLAYLNG